MKHPRRAAGFTLAEIMIVVAVIGLLAAISIPQFMKARNASHQSVCVNNLRQIDSAKTMLALEDRMTTGQAIEPTALSPFLRQPFESIREPASGAYEVNNVGLNPSCTIGAPHILPGTSNPEKP